MKNKVEPQEYIKRPVLIDAVQFDGENGEACAEYINDISGEQIAKVGKEVNVYGIEHQIIDIETLEGTMTANPGDYIIRGVADEFYPCKPSIFEATYVKKVSIDHA